VVGQVSQGSLSTAIGAGYGFYSSAVPIADDLNTNGFPNVDGMQYLTFSAANGAYSTALNYNGRASSWQDAGRNNVAVNPAVGSGFVVFNAGSAASWNRSFVVQ
jgi:hypothetical protein